VANLSEDKWNKLVDNAALVVELGMISEGLNDFFLRWRSIRI